MQISTKALRAHINHRDLVSIRRAAIDDHSIQGFVLDCSESLLLFQYVYDFHLDGFLVLRRKDITALTAGETHRFQRELLLDEGVIDHIDFDFRVPIQSFQALLASLALDEIVIVEDETTDPKRFLIGTVSDVGDCTATIRHFTGIARLVDPPEAIPTDRITSCRVRTNYISFYQRYFGRVSQLH